MVGGGHAGLTAALRLGQMPWGGEANRPEVMLVDESERFEFKPMLYQLLTGEVESWEVAPRYRDLLDGSNVTFVPGRVSGISLPGSQTSTSGAGEGVQGRPVTDRGGSLSLEDGTQVEWDWLVLALGAETRLSGVPGAVEHAMPFTCVQDAVHLEERLALLEQNSLREGPIHVTVVGGGFSGVELAMCVKARLGAKGSVVLLERGSDILKSGATHSREQARNALKNAGVHVRTDTGVKQVIDGALVVTHSDAGGGGGGMAEENLKSDVTLWTVGVQPAGGPTVLGDLPRAENGFLHADATLQVHGHPRIFALGDIASVPDVRAADLPARRRGDTALPRLPATAQVAMQQAEYLCWNIWFASRGRPLLNFRYQHLGEMMSLGPGRGSIAASPLFGGVGLDGPLAELARKAVYALRMPTSEHRTAVGLSWLARGLSELPGLRNRDSASPPPRGPSTREAEFKS